LGIPVKVNAGSGMIQVSRQNGAMLVL